MQAMWKMSRLWLSLAINAGYVENAPTLAQPGSALFHYVAKMAAVEHEKCTSPHTSRLDHFQYTYFRLIWIGTPYVLKLRLVSTDSMDIGTRRCNHEADEATAKSGVGPLWFKKWLLGEHYRPTTQGEVSIEAEIKNFLSPWIVESCSPALPS